MGTKNARYMVTVNEEISFFLNSISKETHKSISGVIHELLCEAIDLRDDYYLSKLAEEAEKKCEGRPTIPAEEVFRKCGLV
jgi:hypothetical protein